MSTKKKTKLTNQQTLDSEEIAANIKIKNFAKDSPLIESPVTKQFFKEVKETLVANISPDFNMKYLKQLAFEPLKSNTFILEIDEIEAFAIKNVTLSPIILDDSSGKIIVTFYCPVAPSVLHQLVNFNKTNWFLFKKLKSFKHFYNWLFNQRSLAVLNLLSPAGTVINKFIFSGIRLENIELSSFDYEVGMPLEAQAVFSYKSRKLD